VVLTNRILTFKDMAAKTTPLAPVFERFIRAKEAEGRSAATIAWYRIALDQFLAFAQPATMRDFSEDVVRAFMDAQTTPHKARHVAVALKSFSSWLADLKVTPENVLVKISTPTVDDNTRDELSEEDFRSALEGTLGGRNVDRDQALLKILSLEGLRFKEAWLLEIRDVDFDNRVITLRKEIVKGKYRSRRALLFPDVARTLERYLATRDIRDETERVFLTDEGKPFTYWGLKQLVRRLRKRTGVKNLTPHYLRHTGISVAIRSGALDRDEARRMFWGRGSDARMLDRYDHTELSENRDRPSPMSGFRKRPHVVRTPFRSSSQRVLPAQRRSSEAAG
jgi:site-specific recombinase XerD